MPINQKDNESTLCVVLNPPDDLFQKAAKFKIDLDDVIVRFTQPRKIIAKLPFQLVAGLEVVTDPEIVREELEDVMTALRR